MNKAELLDWLREEHRQWQVLLEGIDPAYMEQAGLNGEWSFKDLIAHLTPDGLRTVARLQAAQDDKPEPPPPWPAHLEGDDEINAWLYETNRERSLGQILAESQQMFQHLFTAVEELPDDVKIETVHEGERRVYFVRLADRRIRPGEIFDHFHDGHEQDLRAWLTRIEKG